MKLVQLVIEVYQETLVSLEKQVFLGSLESLVSEVTLDQQVLLGQRDHQDSKDSMVREVCQGHLERMVERVKLGQVAHQAQVVTKVNKEWQDPLVDKGQ